MDAGFPKDQRSRVVGVGWSGAMPGAGHNLIKSTLLRRVCSAALFLGAVTCLSAAAHSATKRSATKLAAHPAISHVETASHPHVYLMRGLLNIFSLGMDQLAVQIANHGVQAVVYNHSVEDAVVGDIVQKYRSGDHGPYILVGHSLGADAVMTMAQQLNAKGVPIALVVPF